MASREYVRNIRIQNEEMPDGTVRVDCFIPGFQESSNEHRAKNKNGYANISWQNRGMGFEISACFNEGKKNQMKYGKVIKQLPSLISIDKSKWKIEKDKIVVTLVKVDPNISWLRALHQNSLDQQDSSSSEDSD